MAHLAQENHPRGININETYSDSVISHAWDRGQIPLDAHKSHKNSYHIVTIVPPVLIGHLSPAKSVDIFENHFPLSISFRISGESRSRDFKISIQRSHDAFKLANFEKNDQNGFSDVAEATKFTDLASSKMESYANRVRAISSRYWMNGDQCMARASIFSMERRECQSLNNSTYKGNYTAHLQTCSINSGFRVGLPCRLRLSDIFVLMVQWNVSKDTWRWLGVFSLSRSFPETECHGKVS
jgi:hypothetical protein